MDDKIYLVFISSLFILFLSCSSSQPTTKKTAKELTQKRKDSLALAMLEKDSTSNKQKKKEEIISFDTSSVTFEIVPSDSFNLTSSNFLKFKVEPKKNMQELYYRWKDPEGEIKKYKQVTNLKNMSPQEVKRKIGRGRKKITALYHFDKSHQPIKRTKELVIYSEQKNGKEKLLKSKKKKQANKSSDKTVGPSKKLLESAFLDSISNEITLLKQAYFDDIFFDQGEWQLPSSDFNSKYWLTFNKVLKLLKNNPNIKILLEGSVDSKEYKNSGLQLGLKRAATIGEFIQKLYKNSQRKQIGKRIHIDSTRKFKFSSSNQRTKLLNRSVSITFELDSVKNRLSLYDYHKSPQKDNKIKVKKESVDQRDTIQDLEEKYNKARELFISNKYDNALKIFRKIVNNQPKHALADNAQWWIGEIYYMQEKYMEAVSKYKKIFGLGNGNKAAYAQYRIGCCYYKLKDYNKAIKELKKVNNYSNAAEVKKKARFTMKRAIEEREKM